MPFFTIEATYRIPIYRQRTYEADTVEQPAVSLSTTMTGRIKRRISNPPARLTSPAPGRDPTAPIV